MSWNSFFHSRFGPEGMKLVGWLRVFYAVLFLADRFCFGLDLDFLLSPTHGVLNYRAAIQNPMVEDGMYTLFGLAPDSEALLWGLHYVGIVQGILLLLGVFPKFQLVCLYINLISFQHQNHMLWDGEDRMFKLWAALFLLFPMHTVTIFDSFGKKIKNDDSWSMWPIRLFQLEMTIVYMGASLSKINSKAWAEGDAMYYIAYTSDYYPGVLNPDFLFNYLFPLKLFCWSAMFLEVTGWTLVWVPQTRFVAVIGMFALHVGIDLTMNMYAFEWLAIIGWCVFLIQPTIPFVNPSNAEKEQTVAPSRARRMGNIILMTLLSVFTIDAFPVEDIYLLVPKFAQPFVGGVEDARAALYDVISPAVNRLGLQQGVWNMYTGDYPDSSNCYYRGQLYYPNGTSIEWNSPYWINMTWWERKMKMRLMNYYDSGESNMAAASWVAFAKYLQKTHSQGDSESQVLTVDMILRCEGGVEYPEDIGWFEPIRQPYEEWMQPMMTLDVCGDDFEECGEWKEKGLCEDYREGMTLYCQKTCGMCSESDYIVTWPNRQDARWYEPEGHDIFTDMYQRFPPPFAPEEN